VLHSKSTLLSFLRQSMVTAAGFRPAPEWRSRARSGGHL